MQLPLYYTICNSNDVKSISAVLIASVNRETQSTYYGLSSEESIKTGIKKISKKDKGFIVVQSDMPYIKTSDINKIYISIKKSNNLVHVLKFKNKVGNPIGFDISVIKKFKKIKGDIGAKFMVKRLKKRTNFIKVSSDKIFKDFDLKKDFN